MPAARSARRRRTAAGTGQSGQASASGVYFRHTTQVVARTADYCRATATMERPPSRPPTNQVFVARQPILDKARRVFGYELLYRHAGDAVDAGDVRRDQAMADHATAHL